MKQGLYRVAGFAVVERRWHTTIAEYELDDYAGSGALTAAMQTAASLLDGTLDHCPAGTYAVSRVAYIGARGAFQQVALFVPINGEAVRVAYG